jgi:SAM-dependent methyltransferase
MAEGMDIELVRAINRLWLAVYPGLARQAAEHAPPQLRSILEVGCFSGGTGIELLKLFPESRLTIALEMPELAKAFFSDWSIGRDEASRITVAATQLVPLALPDASFDLAICRGVFFFLSEHETLPAEMHRVLAPGGRAFLGGGFGSHTPQDNIIHIAEESRRLNYALGKTVITRSDFEALLSRNAVPADIVEDGGLWAVLKKQERRSSSRNAE